MKSTIDGSVGEKTSSFVNGRALVIAIAHYDEINSLPEAVLNDARDISNVLSSPRYCGYQSNQIVVLLDDAATLGRIRRALATLASTSRKEDTVVIYFSGHGARFKDGGKDTSLLLPVDCQRSDPLFTSLSEQEFSQALAAIPARRLLVVLDACHSAGAGNLKQKGVVALEDGFAEKDLQKLAEGAGRVIIASSRPNETSLVMRGSRNSVFTGHLLAALRGAARTHGDGLIRVFEIFNYVAEKVRGAVPGKQHPVFKANDLEDNFPIALEGCGTTKSVPAILLSTPWRQMEEIFPDLYPSGPLDDEIWLRAGGDVSRLHLSGTGRAMWFSAIRTLRQGGGGLNITVETLLATALADFPHHAVLRVISKSLRAPEI
jgi:metacaspase-1